MNVILIGVNTFPTIPTTLAGLIEKRHVMLKKMSVKISKGVEPEFSDKKGFTPISKETFPDLGKANKGPIAN